MGLNDYIVLGIVVLLVLGAMRTTFKRKKAGILCSSCRNCSGCQIKNKCQKAEIKARNCH